jgi:hypothetical protein
MQGRVKAHHCEARSAEAIVQAFGLLIPKLLPTCGVGFRFARNDMYASFS